MILAGLKTLCPPRARYTYNPSNYGWPMSQKPMFGDLLDAELARLQTQTQSYEMGR